MDMEIFICNQCRNKGEGEHLFCAISDDENGIHCPYCGKKGYVHKFEG